MGSAALKTQPEVLLHIPEANNKQFVFLAGATLFGY
jgi:hypothetical protein